jgi:ABC-type dipeptide/oligopeptide/nickel transport system permease component
LARFIAQRFLGVLPVLAGVCVITFLLVHLVPGDPVDLLLGDQATKQDKDNLRHELGLDKSLPEQFVNYIGGILHGDLGVSMQTREPVGREIARRMPATLELTSFAMLLALLWGLPWGAWAGARPGSRWDYSSLLAGLFAMSLPGVFLGPLLIYVFAIRLDWLPVSERGGLDHLLLPALSLAIPLGAVILRITRASMAEVINDDYIRTARSKGLNEPRIYLHHALRNALMPVVTIVGLQVGALLTGTVITETIFDWPGLGNLLYGAINRRDYPVVQGCVLLIAATYIFVNLATDLIYGLVNPRVRLS